MVSDFNPPEHDDDVEILIDQLATMQILIASTERPFCDSICDQLHMHGFENIYMANDSDAVIELLAEEPIDLVLSDVSMPGVNGYDLLQALKRHGHFCMTSLLLIYKRCNTTEMQDVFRCIQAGADDSIPTPVEFDTLGARVRASLERKHLRFRELELLCRLIKQEKEQLI